jgi:phosphoglycerol transferase
MWWVLTGSILTILITVFVFKLWDLNPRIPVLYSGDGLLTLNGLRNMKLGNWYWSTNKLGAPFGQDLRDFPAIADNLHLAILWVGIKIFRDEFLVFNGFFFATYLFAFWGGYAGCRMLRLRHTTAILVGVLYAFLPFHFLHGPGHLYLSAYWPIPIWFAFLVNHLLPDRPKTLPTSLKPAGIATWVRSRSGVQATLIAFVAATTGLYYAFFFLALCLVSMCVVLLRTESRRRFAPLAWSASVTVMALAIQFFPIWLYQKQHGDNLSIVKRSISAIEFYSLKMSNLLLPVAGHRLHFFDQIRQRANPAYLIGEGTDALGVLGSIGFLILLVLLFVASYRKTSPLHRALATLTVSCFVIAMTGGFSYLVAIGGFTQVRVWSRISIVIAFPALVATALLIERIVQKKSQLTQIILMLGILLLGVLDTNPGHELPSYKESAISWNRDQSLVQKIEQRFGPNALVFQLPEVPFPENPPVFQMSDYEQLRGYMHSNSLRWSYGSIKGRHQLSLQADQEVQALRNAHFSAIVLDVRGFEDRGKQLIAKLEHQGAHIEFSNEISIVLSI